MPDNNYREMYVTEALEHAELINQTLLKLEENPDVREHIDAIFRSAHTIKGMAATMGYEQTKELCKNLENIFDKIRKKESKLTGMLASAIFKCIDALQEMINDEKKTIDLESYISLLENPEKSTRTLESEPESEPTQLPTIRVKMSDLDLLVNSVGELIISKMKLENTLKNEGSTKSQHELMELTRLLSDIQYQSMKIRLVPIETIFGRFTRVVRDTANKLDKKIHLEMKGANIELDRTVLDAILDPLLHILRNCVDHGLESPSERKRIGKPETGKITLTAFHAGEQIAVKIEDDGRGIDIERLKVKAVENGLISSEEANQMSDDKAIDLLGTPGLSTAKTVTDISGRGVGMDVVINRVREFGGNIEITTQKEKGTCMILTLPLSISIIGGLLVNVSNQKYVLPLSTIRTTLKIKPDQIKSTHGIEVIDYQNKIIPIVHVAQSLGLENNPKTSNQEKTVVIVNKGGKSYGLIVDSFERKQEVVVKKFSNTSDLDESFSNATILPDGRVALILDPGLLI